jgi:hypothetical protein
MFCNSSPFFDHLMQHQSITSDLMNFIQVQTRLEDKKITSTKVTLVEGRKISSETENGPSSREKRENEM